MRVLIGSADVARAGVALALRGFPGTIDVKSFEPIDAECARATLRVSAGVVDSDLDVGALGALSVTRAGDARAIAINARCADGETASLVAVMTLEAVRAMGEVEEACVVFATRDETLELESREAGFLAYEDARCGAKASTASGIVRRPLGERGVAGGDGVMAVVLAALTASGTPTRALYAPAFERCSESEALEVTHRLGRAIEASAFGWTGYDASAVERLRPAPADDDVPENASLYT